MDKPLSKRLRDTDDGYPFDGKDRIALADEIAKLESALAEKEKENAELWGWMHFIRDNIRQVEWHHLEMEHPEVAGWFDSKGGWP